MIYFNWSWREQDGFHINGVMFVSNNVQHRSHVANAPECPHYSAGSTDREERAFLQSLLPNKDDV